MTIQSHVSSKATLVFLRRLSTVLSGCSTSSSSSSSSSNDEEVPHSESHSRDTSSSSSSIDSSNKVAPTEPADIERPSQVPKDTREKKKNQGDVPTIISYSPDGSPEDPSFASTNSDDSMYLQYKSSPHSILHPVPSAAQLAAVEDERVIKRLERELNALLTAMKSYPKESKIQFKLQTHIDRVREELDAVLQDIQISSHTMRIEIMAPSTKNLGLGKVHAYI